jgi:glycosyltransferase involved in cell wall biosynthesis
VAQEGVGRSSRRVSASLRSATRRISGRARVELDWLATRRGAADLALFHEFAPSPSGGGHQFLRALVGDLERRGLRVEVNRLSAGTPACLFNSFNFDSARLRRFARAGCRMVHRVDGPIGVYRGYDDGSDRTIAAVNAELADATVLQSRYSLAKHRELGFELRDPVVISNTVDPAIFRPPLERAPLYGRKVRVIATSWSDNARKGAGALEWLDRNLDWDRYELTFVGRAPVPFERVRVVGPVASAEVARLLGEHDVYLAPSRDDPCSNALLEALACGLPAVYLDSGGHPELVGDGGLPFRDDSELPAVLDRLVAELDERRGAIGVPSLADVADRYLAVLGLPSEPRA